MTKLSKIFRDRPTAPLETAMWWVEYVLRHDDTSHLRPMGHDQYWFVRRQVDIWAVVTLTVLVVAIFFVVIVRKVVKGIFSRKRKSPSPEKTKTS